jgi:hypothetical protein
VCVCVCVCVFVLTRAHTQLNQVSRSLRSRVSNLLVEKVSDFHFHKLKKLGVVHHVCLVDKNDHLHWHKGGYER